MSPRQRRPNRPRADPLPFDRKLVLNQWLLRLFGIERLDELAEHLRDEALQGFNADNVHKFHEELCLRVPADRRPDLPDAVLLEHDIAIVAITQRLNERRITRGHAPIVWKYFQYLALLFTEIYLDRLFRDPRALLGALNERIRAFNEDKDESNRVAPLDEAADAWRQLNKIAFWMATGSGKTLLMHAHILQYRRFLEAHGRTRDLNRIILLTPNEGLSQQHLREFDSAGMDAEIFDKDGRGLFAGQAVEILEVTRLRDEAGEKTVAVEAFEGNNLVLVDEGHRGASAGGEGAWMKYRNALCEHGFSFEYSATFGQAVKGSAGLTNLYARSTLFDYSYRWFYGDGFGKDYHIVNLAENRSDEWTATYLTGCLLEFYQQQRLYREQASTFRPFNLEPPLWVFVGGSVTATLSAREAPDIVEILKFLSAYVSGRSDSVRRIAALLREGLVARDGTNLFGGRFKHLNAAGLTPRQLFDDTLATVFNASGGGTLHVDNLKGVTGEVAVHLGENPPCGVINVGDDAKLITRCEEAGLSTGEREFSGSLFQELDRGQSSVNVLIGSRKFTEGWNSWRVSTMGLMNVGRGEGAQIIQLFGRGVRLKGRGMSLKRTGSADARPRGIEALETLNVFGIRADYMKQFREYLEEEGLPTKDRIEIVLPVVKNLGRVPLKTLRLRKTIRGVDTGAGDAWRKLGPVATLQLPDGGAEYLRKYPVTLDWYPKVQAMQSAGVIGGDDEGVRNPAALEAHHVALLDIDQLYFELERYKSERGWHNLNLSRAVIPALLTDTTWYRLLIPSAELEFDSFDRVWVWQEIALALLRKYVERYYAFRRREWELPHLEYQDLAADDANFPSVVREGGVEPGYRILVDESREDIVRKLRELKAAIGRGDFRPWEFAGIKAVSFGNHLYQPLLFLDGAVADITPAPLNKGERRFVEDLKAFRDANPALFANRELHLLRNQSRGRGVGFFEADNFHPDFILWQVEGGRQRIAFVDPKGLRQVTPTDAKVAFHRTIKEIEERLGDRSVTLESFIVSNTRAHVVERQWNMTAQQLAERHIVFQEDDRDGYVRTLLMMA